MPRGVRSAPSSAYIRSRQREVDAYLLRPTAPKRASGLMQLLNRATDATESVAEAARRVLSAASWLRGGGGSHAEHDASHAFRWSEAEALGRDAWSDGLARQAVEERAAAGLAAAPSAAQPLFRAEGSGALEADAVRVDGRGRGC